MSIYLFITRNVVWIYVKRGRNLEWPVTTLRLTTLDLLPIHNFNNEYVLVHNHSRNFYTRTWNICYSHSRCIIPIPIINHMAVPIRTCTAELTQCVYACLCLPVVDWRCSGMSCRWERFPAHLVARSPNNISNRRQQRNASINSSIKRPLFFIQKCSVSLKCTLPLSDNPTPWIMRCLALRKFRVRTWLMPSSFSRKICVPGLEQCQPGTRGRLRLADLDCHPVM